DTGDGDYTYPTNKALKKGADLREFRVTYDKDNLYLLIKTDRPGDWWVPYRLIGIDQDGAKGGKGGTQVLAQGDIDELSSDSGSFGELKVSPELACEYVIAISQTYKGRIWDANGKLVAFRNSEADDTPGFKVDDANWNAVEVAIPLSLIGGSPQGQTWRFIVATGQQDYDVAREMEVESSEWHGGGGEESGDDGVDPDYYDLASPDKETQEKELGSYKEGADPGNTDAFATIEKSYLIVNFGGKKPM
ncbi:MAG: glucodextranase DOMON-like domain-containing protein, partial [Candidatus Omnitrophota bacterium]